MYSSTTDWAWAQATGTEAEEEKKKEEVVRKPHRKKLVGRYPERHR